MAITYRNVKGSKLTIEEGDENFSYLDGRATAAIGFANTANSGVSGLTSTLNSLIDQVGTRISFDAREALTGMTAGKLVFQLDDSPDRSKPKGFYFWNGTFWDKIASKSEGSYLLKVVYSGSGLIFDSRFIGSEVDRLEIDGTYLDPSEYNLNSTSGEIEIFYTASAGGILIINYHYI